MKSVTKQRVETSQRSTAPNVGGDRVLQLHNQLNLIVERG